MSVGVVTGVVVAAEARVATTLGRIPQARLTRRCADLAELLAVVTSGRAEVVVVSADLPGLDRSAVQVIRDTGTGIIGLYDAGDEQQQRSLLQWQILHRVSVDAPVEEYEQALEQEAAEAVDRTGEAHPAPADPDEPTDLEPPVEEEPEPVDEGQIVVVWGPVGAPGRTTVAVNLAAELAELGITSLVVDADTYAASSAQHLALLDEAPGIAAAARLADAGRLDLRSLAAAAPQVREGMRILTGLPRADRWPELRGPALEEILQLSTRLAQVTVVDVAAPLEDDEELSYDTLAPRRNAATVTALRAASTVLAVGSADPVGLQRLVRGLDEVSAVTGSRPRTVVTKVRSSAVGTAPEHKVTEALDRFAGVDDLVLVPDDRAALDRALLAGHTLLQEAPGSPARRAIADLAARLGGVDAPARGRRARRLRRRRGHVGRSA